jgi:hypothetical protein
MKINWTHADSGTSGDQSPKDSVPTHKPTHLQTGHNRAELFLKFDDNVVIMPPIAAKRLMLELEENVAEWEKLHGVIPNPPTPPPKPRPESAAKRVLKQLYKSRRVAKSLISVNTSRRRHPDKKD